MEAAALLPQQLDLLTLAQWGELPEDVQGELVDGHLIEEEMPSFEHEAIVLFLASRLLAWLGDQGFVAVSGVKYAVAPQRGRLPDLTVFLPGGRVPPRRGVVTVAPDIAVEVVSPSLADQRRDRVEKLAEYAAFGIPYYWIVDLQLRTFEVFERGADGRYIHALGAASGILTDVPGCTGLTLNLDVLWAQLDRLGPTTDEGA